jgi:hypothetical protein
MIWQTFIDWLNPFLWGFAIGFFWYPAWTFVKKLWAEFQQARKEW